MEYFENFPATPSVLRRFRPTSELGGATDDGLRGHDGHTCVVVKEYDGDDAGKYLIRFANGDEGIAFADELEALS